MSESLRDQLSAAYDEVAKEPQESAPQATETPAAPVEGAEPKSEAAQEPEKPGRTAGRARDEQGRLLPGKALREPEAPQAPAALAVEAKPRPPRPSSWKKEYWDHWEKIDPSLAEYLHQREGEFAKGVSTYKQEWERAKPLLDAVAPYQQDFQRWGIDPAKQFSKYAEIHKSLAFGSPEQKLSTLLRIAQDYQVPVQQLFVQGQDGQIYFNQQLLNQQHQSQPAPQPDVEKLVASQFAQHLAIQQAREFSEAKGADGKPLHPHYEVVRETMAQLLESGLADDIPSAYEAAIRHPRHSEIFDTLQKQQREREEAERQKKAREEAERARRNSVSPKSSTPAGASPGAKKGLRATLEDAFDQHVGGRV